MARNESLHMTTSATPAEPWDLGDIRAEKINRAVMGILDRVTNHTRIT